MTIGQKIRKMKTTIKAEVTCKTYNSNITIFLSSERETLASYSLAYDDHIDYYTFDHAEDCDDCEDAARESVEEFITNVCDEAERRGDIIVDEDSKDEVINTVMIYLSAMISDHFSAMIS